METTYTCPMHPEIRREAPAQCPKCGMTLVLESELAKKPHLPDRGLGIITWRSYLPLIAVFALLFAQTALVSWWLYDPAAGFLWKDSVRYFMTGFFLVFATFKLVDLKGFAEGYSTYDLLAAKWFAYGYIYPFIELTFGLLMLTGLHGTLLLGAEAALMLFSGAGVALKLAKGEEFQCACLGTFLKVPLTYVTLVEDFGMAALALILVSI